MPFGVAGLDGVIYPFQDILRHFICIRPTYAYEANIVETAHELVVVDNFERSSQPTVAQVIEERDKFRGRLHISNTYKSAMFPGSKLLEPCDYDLQIT